jgi:hypothetical protein
MKLISGIVTVVYLLVGVVIAANEGYFASLGGLNPVVSAILAVLLWPLVLLGVNLHIGRTGGADRSMAMAALPFLLGFSGVVRRRRGRRASGWR